MQTVIVGKFYSISEILGSLVRDGEIRLESSYLGMQNLGDCIFALEDMLALMNGKVLARQVDFVREMRTNKEGKERLSIGLRVDLKLEAVAKKK